ncbi:hypothetical protein PENSUB_121 [Penicillium subrubescens]|jgi:hypothetical protein|uniref:Uncharacterized protein n=1 Tax=Penicillium subrubescens TaxID=1316194 RepID=A0A1Q5UNR6_9EURO|nr:hypothetical protein PENSUB_121 [Penicillium subrubescens]
MAGCAGPRSDVVVQLATAVLALLGGVGVPGCGGQVVNGVTEEVGWGRGGDGLQEQAH